MTRLSVYDPFSEVFPELFRSVLQPSVRTNGDKPMEIRVDVKEAAKAYTVEAEIPGVAKDDIHVQIDGNRVAISAEVKRNEEKKEGERVLRSERYYGAVSRVFSLASEIDEAQANARFDNGVLTLTLPKKEATGGRKLTVS
ncbi:MAG: Hsp20/alpha crystallin family protein [Burkholderiaceae bacterium]|nr:Hsp20/alpha crystallin family protein [Burkholderiaceae bacterium]